MSEGRYRVVVVLAIIFLGVTFIVAGVGKLLAGPSSLEPFVLPVVLSQSFSEAIYNGVPYIEIIIGGMLILGIAIRFAASLSALLIMGFMVSNTFVISLGRGGEPCGCFGVVGGLTTNVALAMDAIMLMMVVVILAYYRGDFFNIPLVFRRKEKA